LNSVLKGILFDYDGTLADTMEGHYLAWKAAVGEYGITISAEDYYPLEGIGMHEIAREFTKGLSLTETAVGEIVRNKKKYFVERQSQALTAFYPGVESLVSELKVCNVPMAIVTAGHLDQLQQSVPRSFLQHFNALVTGDMFTHGKPDPEPYLRGAETLGLSPRECVAVENAPLGVESAKQAHIYCIAICSTVKKDSLRQADEVLESFLQLKSNAVIRKIIERTPGYRTPGAAFHRGVDT